LYHNFSVAPGKTSALPNVYRNSFTAGILEFTNEFRYSENNRYQSTIRKRTCNNSSCSARQSAAENDVTTVPTYNNFTTVINQVTRAIPSIMPIWYLLYEIRNAVVMVVPPLSLVTNSLSIAVFIHMRRKMQSELFLVFVCLSVIDTFALARVFNTYIVLMISRKMALLYFNVGCQMINWIQDFCRICSGWLVLLYTFERFISVRFPLKRAMICSRRRMRIALLCILVLVPVSEMYDLILFKKRYSSCYVVGNTQRKIYSYMKLYSRLLLGTLLPYTCIAFLNVLIVHYMTRYRKKRAALQAGTTSSEDRIQRSMTIMLFCASTYSLLTTMPQIIANCIDATNSVQIGVVFYMFRFVAVSCIAPLNYCGNFVFYFIGGRQFRNELFKMIRCRKPRGEYKTIDMVSCSRPNY